jgi:hypothetical protein
VITVEIVLHAHDSAAFHLYSKKSMISAPILSTKTLDHGQMEISTQTSRIGGKNSEISTPERESATVQKHNGNCN